MKATGLLSSHPLKTATALDAGESTSTHLSDDSKTDRDKQAFFFFSTPPAKKLPQATAHYFVVGESLQNYIS